MAKKPALGKGIEALMGANVPLPGQESAYEELPVAEATAQMTSSAAVPAALTAITEIEIDLIDVNPYQPRTEFDEAKIEELAASIKKLGIIQPLTLRRLGQRYQIISGERRLRASKLAGLTHVPAYVREADDQGMIEMALVENIQRADLNAVEIALSFQRLIKECNLTQEELAPRVGKNRATISNYLRLLQLPDEVQYTLRQGLISMGHARALLSLGTSELQIAVMRQILDESLSVRAVEELVKNLTQPPAEETPAVEERMAEVPEGLSYLEDMQSRLEQLLGWGVQVKPGPQGKGKVVITYRSEGERLELMRRLGLENA